MMELRGVMMCEFHVAMEGEEDFRPVFDISNALTITDDY